METPCNQNIGALQSTTGQRKKRGPYKKKTLSRTSSTDTNFPNLERIIYRVTSNQQEGYDLNKSNDCQVLDEHTSNQEEELQFKLETTAASQDSILKPERSQSLNEERETISSKFEISLNQALHWRRLLKNILVPFYGTIKGFFCIATYKLCPESGVWMCKSSGVQQDWEKLVKCMIFVDVISGCTPEINGLMGTVAIKTSCSTITVALTSGYHICSNCWTATLCVYLSRVGSYSGFPNAYSSLQTSILANGIQAPTLSTLTLSFEDLQV